jgi:hypothetical protein
MSCRRSAALNMQQINCLAQQVLGHRCLVPDSARGRVLAEAERAHATQAIIRSRYMKLNVIDEGIDVRAPAGAFDARSGGDRTSQLFARLTHEHTQIRRDAKW